ncbi:MAG: hypothetical protein AVDCRST_MAG49-2435 [uncultured Thermomicrobiales bacterium]|uniref:Twin-arginine translocation signal domain-containing protein n=1 Tax=uncultured Thermomicrobiales bacterium TaxID=1645740 RepID=A0A6J4UXZ0_9BACT|nr:MAG: hypothetical protein AVDCRST_MAG49-2435 [uncultured Thermomicrobiales bacterium]
MDPTRFDGIARTFAGRRASRRAAIAAGAAGAVAVLGAAAPGKAQEAAPGAEGNRTFFLFVQTFLGGTLVPKEGEDGTYVLTLTGGPGQTIYFSDRPERIVGTLPTYQFLDALGFPPDNPPNAALVARTDDGEDIVVVELFNPVYTDSFGESGAATLTYDVRVLADYAEEGLAHLAQRRAGEAPPAAFSEAALFIDDCNPVWIRCGREGIWGWEVGDLGYRSTCWSWSDFNCVPCAGGWEGATRECNELFSECQGTRPNLCTAAK